MSDVTGTGTKLTQNIWNDPYIESHKVRRLCCQLYQSYNIPLTFKYLYNLLGPLFSLQKTPCIKSNQITSNIAIRTCTVSNDQI